MTQQISWYKSAFEGMCSIVFQASTCLDQKNQPVRLAMFGSAMGKECLQIFRNVNFGSGEVNISSALKVLDNFFYPQAKRGLREYVSNSCCQTPDETVDCFVNRLRKLASSCQYGALTKGTEEMIGDGLVTGVQDKNTKAKLLRERALSLDKALDTFKSVNESAVKINTN